ncbi:hypothetical protein [Nostoc sp. WHI]|nr:hypothetical protein [Nostoc sp. WHI]
MNAFLGGAWERGKPYQVLSFPCSAWEWLIKGCCLQLDIEPETQ